MVSMTTTADIKCTTPMITLAVSTQVTNPKEMIPQSFDDSLEAVEAQRTRKEVVYIQELHSQASKASLHGFSPRSLCLRNVVNIGRATETSAIRDACPWQTFQSDIIFLPASATPKANGLENACSIVRQHTYMIVICYTHTD